MTAANQNRTGPSGAARPQRAAALLARAPWRVIGLCLLIIVLLNIDIGRVASQFARIGPLAIAGAAASFLVLLAARCWRWRILTQAVGLHEPLLDNVASCNRSIWLGLATPGRIGEFRRALDLSQRLHWSLAGGGGIVLFDLLLDLGVYAVFALGGLAYFFLAPAAGIGAWAAMLAVAAGLLLAGGNAIGRVARAFPFLLRAPGASEALPALERGLAGAPTRGVLLATAGSATAFVAMIACLVAPMGEALGVAEIITTIGLASVAGAIPISYFGLGTREAALIWFLGERGLDQSAAVAVSFTYLLATLIGVAVSLAADVALRVGRTRKEK